jgi:hypothetical protein
VSAEAWFFAVQVDNGRCGHCGEGKDPLEVCLMDAKLQREHHRGCLVCAECRRRQEREYGP